jgi:N-acetyltransferase
MKLTEKTLENSFVRLEPLSEAHRAQLEAATNEDQEIWPLYAFSMAGEHFSGFWARVNQDRQAGRLLPLAVLVEDHCIGISCYTGIDPANSSVEIGGTYYRPSCRGTGVNPATKHLLLGHAFECGARRVQFRVDALNDRSRAAMRKLGATQDGILRQDRVTWTGRVRDTVVFSVLANEWPRVHELLQARLGNGNVPPVPKGQEEAGRPAGRSGHLDELPPAARLLDRKIVSTDPQSGEVTLRFEASRDFTNRHGTIQGGMLAAMLDSATGTATMASLPPHLTAVTKRLDTAFHKPAVVGPLTATARLVMQNDRSAVAEAELVGSSGQIVASARAELRVRRRDTEV